MAAWLSGGRSLFRAAVPRAAMAARVATSSMESSERHNTLVHFRFNPEYKAERGRHGEGSNKTGREGEDILLKVPVGTIVYDDETGEKVHDFSHRDERVVMARGGRGGRGNAQFATSTHQAPREHEPGRPGEERGLPA